MFFERYVDAEGEADGLVFTNCEFLVEVTPLALLVDSGPLIQCLFTVKRFYCCYLRNIPYGF